MKRFLDNSGYFLKESWMIFNGSRLTNLISIIANGLIFFVLALVFTGWQGSRLAIQSIENEAEISVYYSDTQTQERISKLVQSIEAFKGVNQVIAIDENEAYQRMETVLGKDAKVLAFFETNPFHAFLEVEIELTQLDSILIQIDQLQEVDFVRDNKSILNKVKKISDFINYLSYLVFFAVGISTIVIIGHIIRQGITNNKDQIETLKLLGAPSFFIGLPFVIVGILMTVCGGIIAAIMIRMVIIQVYQTMAGPLPFIPLPNQEMLIMDVIRFILALSTTLGIVGSLIGLKTAKTMA